MFAGGGAAELDGALDEPFGNLFAGCDRLTVVGLDRVSDQLWDDTQYNKTTNDCDNSPKNELF